MREQCMNKKKERKKKRKKERKCVNIYIYKLKTEKKS